MGILGKILRSAGCAAALALAVIAPGRAQMRGGAPATRISLMRAAPRAANRVATPLNPNFAPLRGVPGLGFDYDHLAAISRVQGNRFPRARRVGTVGYIIPIFSDGLPYSYAYGGDISYESPEPPQPLVSPEPLPIVTPPAQPATEVAAAAQAAPVPEVGQFILMRRDGQVVLAVAFTTASGRLMYVARDGTRHSFPLAELDRDATRQMNDVNGTTLALPE